MPPADANPTLSVVILSYRSPSFLDAQLLGLRGQLGPRDEVIVTEDSREEDTRRVVDRHRSHLPITHLTQADEGRRICRARNRGIIAARGEQILLLDHDVLLPGGCIDRIRRMIRPRWVVGLRRVNLDESSSRWALEKIETISRIPWNRLKAAALWHRHPGSRYLLPLRRRDCNGESVDRGGLASFGLLCHREDLLRVGGFDHRFDGCNYAEDMDLLARMEHDGVRMALAPRSCTVFHFHHRRAFHDLTNQNYKMLDSTLAQKSTKTPFGIEMFLAEEATKNKPREHGGRRSLSA